MKKIEKREATLSGVIGKSLKCAKLIAAEGGDGPRPTETWQTA